MDFGMDAQVREIADRVEQIFQNDILPRNGEYNDAVEGGDLEPDFLGDLKRQAFDEGLWNLALPRLADDEPGTRMTNLGFATVAEILGRIGWASEVFNCHAPDVPNMEILQMFATPAQREEYLQPLLHGRTRSSFAMTEPDVASSDANNIATRIERRGDTYVLNGRKWFATGAANPRCSFLIVVGVTDPDAPRGKTHSMVLVPKDTPGVEIVRKIPVMNHVEQVTPHTELKLTDVEVPVSNRLGEEGAGFLIGQARLGPARVHHCMRAIGRCEILIRLMVERAGKRRTFGTDLRDYSSVQDAIAESRMALEQARLLVQRTAWRLDREGNKLARKDISLIKVAVARAYHDICQRGIQIYGAMGLTNDTPFADALAQARAFRIYDGPDEVHLRTIFRLEEKDGDGLNYTKDYLGR
ncbi:MAG: acyl-CoA dehydrogenase family protein [Minwuia sp.]|uniref:acyl-CoA dehydrogenase family protein n=1 Tax=Minwuia sp. TaxID=2493630 RepID=UPI003A874333